LNFNRVRAPILSGLAPVLHSNGVVKLYLFLLIVFLFPWVSLGASAESVFRNESELGYVVTAGNTDVSTLSIKQQNRWMEDRNGWSLSARYLRSSSEEQEQALQWGLGIKFERILNDDLSVFLGQLVESNIYQLINQRYASDAGAKYYFQKKEKDLICFAELGYRFTRENYPGSFQNYQFGRMFSELEKYWFENASGKISLEYLPNFTRWKSYQLNASVTVSGALAQALSLRSSFELRYNNEPPLGARSNSDRILTVSFVVKI
jgi:hypothetical protein